MVTEQEDVNNKEYASGYGSGRSSDIVGRIITESPFGPDKDTPYYKGYVAGAHDQKEHGWQSAEDCGSGESSSDSSSCCYITSACLDALNIPRTSLEMRAMKDLTRNHILKSFGGRRDYIAYGRKAPRIVEAIRARADSRDVWLRVHENLKKVTSLIVSGNYKDGHQEYKSLVLDLEGKFAS